MKDRKPSPLLDEKGNPMDSHSEANRIRERLAKAAIDTLIGELQSVGDEELLKASVRDVRYELVLS